MHSQASNGRVSHTTHRDGVYLVRWLAVAAVVSAACTASTAGDEPLSDGSGKGDSVIEFGGEEGVRPIPAPNGTRVEVTLTDLAAGEHPYDLPMQHHELEVQPIYVDGEPSQIEIKSPELIIRAEERREFWLGTQVSNQADNGTDLDIMAMVVQWRRRGAEEWTEIEVPEDQKAKGAYWSEIGIAPHVGIVHGQTVAVSSWNPYEDVDYVEASMPPMDPRDIELRVLLLPVYNFWEFDASEADEEGEGHPYTAGFRASYMHRSESGECGHGGQAERCCQVFLYSVDRHGAVSPREQAADGCGREQGAAATCLDERCVPTCQASGTCGADRVCTLTADRDEQGDPLGYCFRQEHARPGEPCGSFADGQAVEGICANGLECLPTGTYAPTESQGEEQVRACR